MTNLSAVFESFVHTEHTLAGIKLKPLCLLHLLWLHHLHSPLVETSLPVSMADVELASIICSSTSSADIIKTISPKSRCNLLFRLFRHRHNLEQEIRKWLAYHNDYLALPVFAPNTDNTDEALPWIFTIAANIIKETGWDMERVLTMPVGSLFWLNISFAYIATGKTNVISDKEQLAMELMRQMQS